MEVSKYQDKIKHISKINRKRVLSRWNKIQEKELEYISTNKHKYPELQARFFGYLAGDGNIWIGNQKTNFHHTARFFPDHDSMIPPFIESSVKIYNKYPRIVKKKNYYELTIDSKIVIKDIVNDGDFGILNWNIPTVALKNSKTKKEWLSAFFDCEAYVCKSHIKIQSVNQNGMEHIARILREFDIKTKSYVYQPKNQKWNTNYILMIHKKIDRKRYFNEIGFYHTVKKMHLKRSLSL